MDQSETEVCWVVIIIKTEHSTSSCHSQLLLWYLHNNMRLLLIVFSIISLSTSQSNLQKVSRIPAKIAQVKVVSCIWASDNSSDNFLQSVVNLFCGCGCRNYQGRFASTVLNYFWRWKIVGWSFFFIHTERTKSWSRWKSVLTMWRKSVKMWPTFAAEKARPSNAGMR